MKRLFSAFNSPFISSSAPSYLSNQASSANSVSVAALISAATSSTAVKPKTKGSIQYAPSVDPSLLNLQNVSPSKTTTTENTATSSTAEMTQTTSTDNADETNEAESIE